MKNPVVSVTHLTKAYNGTYAVDDLSFELERGEIYGFLGQNGAGKSTTIRMLLTLVRPSGGRMEMFGKELSRHRREILRQVGAMIERPDLYKYLTAREHLLLFARMNGIHLNANQISERLSQVGLMDRQHSKVKTFSQGMKQRLGLAIAMVHDPQLLLLDEPTNGLDPQGIADVRNLLLQLSREKSITILISSHLLHEVELIADRMLIIDRGKKIREGRVRELFDAHAMQVMIEVEDAGILEGQLKQARWQQYLIGAEEGKLHFQLDKEDIPHLIAYLVGLQARITSVRSYYSLEEQFLQLTGKSTYDKSPVH